MKRMLLFLAVALAMSGTWTSAHAQSGGVEISKFSSFVVQGNAVQLYWWASEDQSFVEHIVEHGTNRQNFQPIGTIPAIFTGEQGHVYTFLHTTPSPGFNFYRLNIVYDHGLNTYSPTVRSWVGGAGVVPRPANPNFGSNARPLVGEDEDQWNEAIISDIYGRPIMRMRHAETEMPIDELPTGIYILNARYADDWRTSKFVVNK